MRNCLILGSGRSGTSMVAGTLAKSGYFMGDDLWPGRMSNPKGFFEDVEINAINEAILSPIVPKRPRLLGRWFFRDRPLEGQRWLARVPVGTNIPCPSPIAERIRKVVQREPYCFKDPRFCYTTPAWRPFLRGTVFVCVFRRPAIIARSILRECSEVAYLASLCISLEQALDVWTLMYRHVVEIHRHQGSWLFLHYNQVLRDGGLNRLQAFVGAPVDRSFPDPSLSRSSSTEPVPRGSQQLYQQLCELAGYDGP